MSHIYQLCDIIPKIPSIRKPHMGIVGINTPIYRNNKRIIRYYDDDGVTDIPITHRCEDDLIPAHRSGHGIYGTVTTTTTTTIGSIRSSMVEVCSIHYRYFGWRTITKLLSQQPPTQRTMLPRCHQIVHGLGTGTDLESRLHDIHHRRLSEW